MGSGLQTWKLAAATLLAVALAAHAALCQVPAEVKDKAMREVRALVRMGSYSAAAAQLEKLNSTYPNDSAIVAILFQVLMESKDYSRAEQVMAAYVAARPDDPRGLADLATVYSTQGRRQDCMGVLERLIGLAPKETWSYQAAYQVLWRSGQLPDAIEVIRRGRQAYGDSALFAADAAQILRTDEKYQDATMEYLLAWSGEDDPRLAVDGIVAMAEKSEARAGIVAGLNAALARPGLEQAARTGLWQIYLLDGDCTRAFEQISLLARDRQLSAEILAIFAARSKERACYSECSGAYNLALALPENKAHVPDLLLNRAGCEAAGGLLDAAALTYGEVVKRYPGGKAACQAEVALGRMARDRGLLAEAVAHADKVIASGAAGDSKYDAILFKGDCQVRAGDLDEAFKTYDMVGTDWDRKYAQEAFFNLGEIKLYQAALDEALSYYNVTLREYADEPRANDAIDRLMLLKAAKGDLGKVWLGDFGRAALLRRQGKADEAVGVLQNLAADPGQGAVKTESIRMLSEIFVERGEYDRAIRLYRLLGDSLATSYSPDALEAIGDVYMRADNRPEAIRAYEDVIVKFPESVSAGEARRKIDLAKRKTE
jgi:TolA-binding protein